MGLQIERKTIEGEKLVGAGDVQVLVRAEALVPGAGRDAIEPLLSNANLYIDMADVQTDRIVAEGSVSCETVYRQGEETTVRALAAHTTLNRVIDIPGAREGMLCRLRGKVDHVEARYENGHIVFQVSCSLSAQVLALTPVEVISAVGGEEGLQTSFKTLDSVKTAAESSEMALLRDSVALPAALDARMTLMDWISVEIDETAPDLGGVRVKGRALVETLISSGVSGRPAVVVRYPLALDQLVELPEWLTANVFAEADVRSVQSHLEPSDSEEGEAKLCCEAEVRVRVYANSTDTAEALTDVYATCGNAVKAETQCLELCSAAERFQTVESVRGTLLIGENAPDVGTVIAARVHSAIGERRNEGGTCVIEGVLEAAVLYMPGGSDLPSAAESEIPFSFTVPTALNEHSTIDIQVISAEASALMSDRLELKAQLGVTCENRWRQKNEIVGEIAEAEPVRHRPGIIVCWPEESEDSWAIGKRYSVAPERVGVPEPGKPVVLKI